MLLTDGNPNKTEDLRVYESAILSVANGEAIDLDVKLGLATGSRTSSPAAKPRTKQVLPAPSGPSSRTRSPGRATPAR